MNMRSSTPKKVYAQDEVEVAVAALIASTRRVRRPLKLLEIAHNLEIALSAYRSLSKLADAIGVSSEMLRQFSRVNKLSHATKQFLSDGSIESVDIADRLSRLPVPDQLSVARAVAHGKLTSDDVRAIVSLRKALPKEKIGKVIDRVKSSRNIKQYVIEFMIPFHKTGKTIKEQFMSTLGKDGIVSFSTKGRVSHAILNTTGKHRLENIAKQKGCTKRTLVNKIIARETI
jgi:hypothetical protein